MLGGSEGNKATEKATHSNIGVQSSKKFYDRVIKHSQRINPLAQVQNSVGNAFLSCRNLGFKFLFNFKTEKRQTNTAKRAQS